MTPGSFTVVRSFVLTQITTGVRPSQWPRKSHPNLDYFDGRSKWLTALAAGVRRPAFRSTHTSAHKAVSHLRHLSIQKLALAIGIGAAALAWSLPSVHADSPSQAGSVNGPAEATDHFSVDPATGLRFPLMIQPIGSVRPLHLVGVGVRTVSFLRVRVYSVGFYVSEELLPKLEGLLSADAAPGKQALSEGQFRQILDEDSCQAALRIQPVRATDFHHLRDGFVRTILARAASSVRSSAAAEGHEPWGADLDDSLNALRACFPKGVVSTQSALYMVRNNNTLLLPAISEKGRVDNEMQHVPEASLIISLDDRYLGAVADRQMTRELFLAYFADNGKAVTEKLKEGILRGLQQRAAMQGVLAE